MTNRYEEWTLTALDGKVIYGATDYANQDGLSERVLVLVHGLSGHMNEYHIKSAANYFSKQGYDVIRFNLYPGGDGRRLIETTLQSYAADLNQVLNKKTKSYDNIFVAGHSYGGPTIMIAQPEQATALSLWDPSFDLPRAFNKEKPGANFNITEEKEYYIWKRGTDMLLSKDFITERKERYGEKECLELSKKIAHIPIQVVAADEGYGDDTISWHSVGHPDNHRQTIENCDHCFWRGTTFEEVLRLSHEWFETFKQESDA